MCGRPKRDVTGSMGEGRFGKGLSTCLNLRTDVAVKCPQPSDGTRSICCPDPYKNDPDFSFRHRKLCPPVASMFPVVIGKMSVRERGQMI